MRIHNGAVSTTTLHGEFQGIPPTGKQVTLVVGKVEEQWVELDLLGLIEQLVAIPEPE